MYCDISDKIKDNLMIFQKYVRRLNETKYVIWYEENITLNLRLLIRSERNKKKYKNLFTKKITLSVDRGVSSIDSLVTL